MVKIINPLGDVKVGKQGEVVYQRKYGEQIRRMAAPKRAIASEAQVAHRQFYRDALTWRKGLSRPNRRYLEGYCIANGVVDSYHIPLPWSHFAMKIYLERIHFIPDLELVEGESVEGEKKESCESFHTVYYSFGLTKWYAQSFEPLAPYSVGKVVLWICKYKSVGTITVGIRNTDGEGKPTGGDLTSGQIDGDLLPAWDNYIWKDIEVTPYALTQGTLYAIVARAPSAEGIDAIQTRRSLDNTCYPRGRNAISTTSGSTWQVQPWDLGFQVWSAEQAGEKVREGIVHVRHPALMSVVHKRNGVVVKGYSTLSSLDEEYLTKQVGLDVIAGDTIEATTIAGIEAKYRVV